MSAYYNENHPYLVEWLKCLIKKKLIAPGDVDERNIQEVKPDDLKKYTQCHFFAGLGGWSKALRLANWPDELEVWTGSCPCQPFSRNGDRNGFKDKRHLWPSWKQLIKERKPSVIFGEQTAATPEWLRLVRSNLETLDYAVGAIPIEAASAGAFHTRDRFWFVADSYSSDRQRGDRPLQMGRQPSEKKVTKNGRRQSFKWPAKPTVPILAYGIPFRVERCGAFGNAIDLRPATVFIKAYMIGDER